MIDKKNQLQVMHLQVPDGPLVTVMPSQFHEFLIPSQDVIKGFAIGESTLRKHRHEHKDELLEGKHFISGVTFSNDGCKSGSLKRNVTMYTKAGIVRLGFFIKSKRAKLFRDWAEDLVIKELDKINRSLPAARRHNRLTQDRLIDILSDVCKVEDKELRLSLTEKLLGGQA